MKNSNSHPLQDYYALNIIQCRDCSIDRDISSHLKYEKLPPFVGKLSKSVLILGHSPKVRTDSEIIVTLDLIDESILKKYVTECILNPLGIELEQCVATNIIKCKTDNMPEDILINGKPIFMELSFNFCSKHLEREISLYDPKLIISLSEKVARLLHGKYSHGVKFSGMQKMVATKQSLVFNEKNYSWIPVVHLPKPKVRAYYFPMQTDRLKRIRDDVQKHLLS